MFGEYIFIIFNTLSPRFYVFQKFENNFIQFLEWDLVHFLSWHLLTRIRLLLYDFSSQIQGFFTRFFNHENVKKQAQNNKHIFRSAVVCIVFLRSSVVCLIGLAFSSSSHQLWWRRWLLEFSDFETIIFRWKSFSYIPV